MQTLPSQVAAAPHPAGTYQSRPRPGFRLPGSARKFAAHCLAEGITAAELRSDAVPGDMLLTELADAADALEAEGLTQAKCRFLLGLGKPPVPSWRHAPAATGGRP